MISKLNYAVTMLLIALYCACGVTGQSASYLLELATSSRVAVSEKPAQTSGSETSSSKSHGYFHHHGSGSHVHYHATHRASPPATKVASSNEEDNHAERLAGPEDCHLDHACPLLDALRLLEQGTGGYVRLSSKLDFASPITTQESTGFAFFEASDHLARGPPKSHLA